MLQSRYRPFRVLSLIAPYLLAASPSKSTGATRFDGQLSCYMHLRVVAVLCRAAAAVIVVVVVVVISAPQGAVPY